MTNEEAIDILSGKNKLCDRNCANDCTDCVIRANALAIEALEKSEKYKWHNLRKNPKDLPNLGDNITVGYIHVNVPKEIIYISYEADEDCLKNLINGNYKQFIFLAWKYIEPFEEVSE